MMFSGDSKSLQGLASDLASKQVWMMNPQATAHWKRAAWQDGKCGPKRKKERKNGLVRHHVQDWR